MWRLSYERLIRAAVWLALGLGFLERAMLLAGFGFTHIGIDDALIMQVAKDYGHGIFREPYLYGQNYNPMLEALLAAPFVRLGAAPWIVLPIITSALALLPFWSMAIWYLRRGHGIPAMIIAAFPMALPLEWGMITTMPRGWVHGIALLSFIPWAQDVRRPFAKHLLTALVLVASVLCNPNALPLAASVSVVLIAWHRRDARFWALSGLAGALGWLVHRAMQGFHAAHPDRVIHPLLPTDLRFSEDLLLDGLSHNGEHFLHLHPFLGLAWIPIVLLLAGAGAFWKRRERMASFALVIPVVVMLLALGIPKVHEGCASVFFPQSRMMLSLPILLAIAAANLLRDVRFPRTALLLLPFAWLGAIVLKMSELPGRVAHQLAHQECAWVREEPVAETQERCASIKDAAIKHQADLIVPIRWPSILVDHQKHFTAHFNCYACEVLVDSFPPVFGAGYDRRSWIRAAHEAPPQGRVLFIGGDPAAWRRAIAAGRIVEDLSHAGKAMHIARCDTIPVGDFLLRMGVDDNLGR
ncbi:MAG: hypothetical protein IPM46_13880 [Flavobacteriales bacterium]|nr:hypothetical protein [Flavobacteriales bacterium]